MLREELLKKIRHIEFATRKVVDDVMTGQYRTHFRGQGMQFSEHRVYSPGDDVRHIDWKVSARQREPLIKKYEEERELTVLLVVDLSASQDFGSQGRLKSEVVAEVAGMLAYAAVHTGDKVGAIFFAGEVEKTIAPKKGRKHVLRLVHEILSFRPKTKGTDLKGALTAAQQAMKQSGIVFVVSDFLTRGFHSELQRISKRNDVVCLRVSDPKEKQVPNVGFLPFQDPETGRIQMVDTGSYSFKRWIEQMHREQDLHFKEAMKGSKAEVLEIQTQEDYGEALVRFFSSRSRRM